MSQERQAVVIGETKVFLRRPTLEEKRLADMEYSKAYAQYLKEGLPLSDEMEKLLVDRGVLGPEYEKKVEAIQEAMAQALVHYREAQEQKDEVAKRTAMQELKLCRIQLLEANTERTKHMVHTVENKSDERQTMFLLSKIVEQEDKSPYWATLEALKQDDNLEFVQTVIYKYMGFINNLPEDFLDRAPDFGDLSEATEEITEEVEAPAAA